MLTLRTSNDDTYTLPLSIFNCSTLTYLELSNCVFKPPNPFIGFQNLIALHLKGTTFVPATSFCVIKAPLLAKLDLILCRGTQYLNIVSPGLKFLVFRDSHSYLVLDCFMNCKNITLLKLEFNGVVDDRTNDKRSTLEKLLVSSPALEVLRLDSFFVEVRYWLLVSLWYLILMVVLYDSNYCVFFKAFECTHCSEFAAFYTQLLVASTFRCRLQQNVSHFLCPAVN